jgi:membrane-associated phospholipid phosphatase
VIFDKPLAALRERVGRPDVEKALLVTGLVGGAAFIALMVGAAAIYDAVSESDGISGLDKPVLNWAISVRTPTLDLWVTAFTNLGRTLPMVLIAGLLTLSLFLRYRRRTIWVLMGVAAAGSVTFTFVGKALVGRSRPALEFAVPPYEASFSFPSGHTLNSTVIAGMLAYLVCVLSARRWLRVLSVVMASIWAVGMGLSRVYLGHHWLTDVAFAWLLGLGWLALLITVHRVLVRLRDDARPRPAPISLPRGD